MAIGKKIPLLLKTQQLILGTGTAIWWLTEPHWNGHKLSVVILKMCCSITLVKLFMKLFLSNSLKFDNFFYGSSLTWSLYWQIGGHNTANGCQNYSFLFLNFIKPKRTKLGSISCHVLPPGGSMCTGFVSVFLFHVKMQFC